MHRSLNQILREVAAVYEFNEPRFGQERKQRGGNGCNNKQGITPIEIGFHGGLKTPLNNEDDLKTAVYSGNMKISQQFLTAIK